MEGVSSMLVLYFRLSGLFRLSLLCLMAMVFTLGCTVGPDYGRPEITTPESFSAALPGTEIGLAPLPEEIEHWWTIFDDPILNQLISEAGEKNLDLRIAIARVEEARAFVGVVSGQYYPQVGAGVNASRQRVSEANLTLPGGQSLNSFDIGVNATWEIDVFGRVRRSVEAATGEFQATEEDRNDVLISVYAEVARNYVVVRSSQTRLAASQHNIESQREIVELTRTRFKHGLASDLDVAQAEQVLASSEATVPAIRIRLENAMHALALLLGREPAALKELLSEPRPIPTLPETVGVGIPADLIRRRPDIRRAERQLAAQTARVGVATAQLYPSFNLLGAIGLAAGDTSALFKSGSHTYTLGGGIMWNLFAGGSIRSQIRVEDARTEQALLRYEKTVLNALRQVEDALVAVAENTKQREALIRNASAAERSLRLALELYKDGLRDFQSTLDAERALFDAVNRAADADGTTVVAVFALYKSLGGGWNPDQPFEPFNNPATDPPAVGESTNEVK
jgi:NodT family efflux transporter outer membrane factor (OMF) lipoprotein